MDIRGRPFAPGNKLGKGRPKGSKNKINPDARKLLEEYKVPLTQAAISLALRAAKLDPETGKPDPFGDPRMLKSLIDLIFRLEREKPIRIGKLSVDTPTDVKKSYGKVARTLSKGEIDGTQAAEIGRFLNQGLEAVATDDLDQRMRALEANEKLQEVRGPIGPSRSGAGCEDQPAEPKPS